MAIRAAFSRLWTGSRTQYAIGCLLLFFILAILGQAELALILVILSIPPALFTTYIKKQQSTRGITDRELLQLVYCFIGGIVPGSIIVLLLQFLLLPIFLFVCFADQLESIKQQYQDLTIEALGAPKLAAASTRWGHILHKLDIEQTLGYFIFLFLMAYIVAGLVEEAVKLWIVQGECACQMKCCRRCTRSSSRSSASIPQRRRQRGWLCHPKRLLYSADRHDSHNFVVFAAVISGALGFSFIENIGYVIMQSTTHKRLVTALLRACTSAPIHAVCGGLTGVRLVSHMQEVRRHRRQAVENASSSASAAVSKSLGSYKTKAKILVPAVLAHGSFDFTVFLYMSLVPQAWIDIHPVMLEEVLPVVGCCIIIGCSGWYLWRQMQRMDGASTYSQVATDLESGERSDGTAILSDDEDESLDIGFGGSTAKVRSVFNV